MGRPLGNRFRKYVWICVTFLMRGSPLADSRFFEVFGWIYEQFWRMFSSFVLLMSHSVLMFVPGFQPFCVLCFFVWRDLSKKMFSLMIDSIAVTLLAGFQFLGYFSEYVWKEPTVWVMFQNMVLGDISGSHDGFGSYNCLDCLEEPTVCFFGRGIEPAQNEHETYTSQQKTYCRTEILGC